MSNFNQVRVLSVHHWTDDLFSFTTTRDPSFPFRSGEFTMVGLKIDKKPQLRAYSLASADYEDRLEFFSTRVLDGPLTSRLQHLKEGDEIIVRRKATGTLVIDSLEDGRNLYLIGTGLAPFLSVIKDPEMIGGSPALVRDARELLVAKGFVEPNRGEPAHFIVERRLPNAIA
ncbi:FAD-binding oxidoreductase [Bradyrhizobium vignae]|nr:FAD-binding oxidoreductase [Bradyrhizobium vignae]